MGSVNRDEAGLKVIVAPSGPFDEAAALALLRAIAQAPEDIPLVIDLAHTQQIDEEGMAVLAPVLARRSGSICFRSTKAPAAMP